jgi:hypothetical protein
MAKQSAVHSGRDFGGGFRIGEMPTGNIKHENHEKYSYILYFSYALCRPKFTDIKFLLYNCISVYMLK